MQMIPHLLRKSMEEVVRRLLPAFQGEQPLEFVKIVVPAVHSYFK
jgi:hypothetical protein